MKLTLAVPAVLLSIATIIPLQGRMVEYAEDAYAMQAPEELVTYAQKVATNIGYDGPYELVIPKKPGVIINPWNRFVARGTNPYTQNPFILINPEWFSKLSEDQQFFLLARCFARFKAGMNPISTRAIPWFFIAFSLFFMFGLYRSLSKVSSIAHNTAIKIAITLISSGLLNYFVMNHVQLKLINYFDVNYEKSLHKTVVQQTDNREAAIQALEAIDHDIKASIAQGETFFVPWATLFEDYARDLKK